MINYSQLALRSFISCFCGIILTLLIGILITVSKGLFWFLLILVWIIISGINGYLLKSRFEPLVYSAFVLIYWIVAVFSFSLLLYGFSTSVLQAINIGNEQLNQLNAIKTALLVTLLTSFILFATLTASSYSFYFIKYYITKAKPKSIAILEQEAYESYESPTDSGNYIQRTDEFD